MYVRLSISFLLGKQEMIVQAYIGDLISCFENEHGDN